jgi:homoserine acetyltransferase
MSCICARQQAALASPSPEKPATKAAPQQFADLGKLDLENGQVIQHCKIGYRTLGTLNSKSSNAILFPTWFSGRSEDLVQLIGPGKIVDDSKFFVIIVDAIGMEFHVLRPTASIYMGPRFRHSRYPTWSWLNIGWSLSNFACTIFMQS